RRSSDPLSRLSTAMPAAATMPGPGEAAVPGEAAMPAEAWVPMRKAVAPPAMIKVVAMIPAPATEPAIDVDVRTVDRGPVTNGLRAHCQANTDAKQQQHY